MLILKCVFRLVIAEHLFESGVVFSLVAQVLMDVHIVSLKIQYASGNIRAVVGNQAAYQIAATIVCFPNLKKVYVADLLFPENAENSLQESRQDFRTNWASMLPEFLSKRPINRKKRFRKVI